MSITMASSDVGDVSWVVPTVGFGTATWVPGTAAHTWQAVAADGMGIGMKGMLLAAKVLATTAVDIFTDPSIAQEAQHVSGKNAVGLTSTMRLCWENGTLC